ncbi:DedA family protein [Catenuloplanes japonicus]|uniref:DedA family protein n=1 Tax=Catenuloplanes japonicus TaxID=33876 RepID=UPI000527A724|nr:VTT domain-containing protein [Catenuloplanes japonicus]
MDPYTWLGPLVLVEGPAATVSAGAMVGAGLARFWPVWAIVVLAEVAGDSLLYLAGRASARPGAASLLARSGRVGASATRALRRLPGVRALPGPAALPRLVVTAKLLDVLAVPAFVAAGVAQLPFRRFAAWVTAGAAVRAAVLLGLGALFGSSLTGLLALPGGFLLLTAAVAIPIALIHLAATHHRTLTRLVRKPRGHHTKENTPCASSSAPTPTPRTSTAPATSPSVSPPR